MAAPSPGGSSAARGSRMAPGERVAHTGMGNGRSRLDGLEMRRKRGVGARERCTVGGGFRVLNATAAMCGWAKCVAALARTRITLQFKFVGAHPPVALCANSATH